jgi:ferredoxin
MTMRIEIDFDLCQGHAMCVEEAPEVFEVDADGNLNVLQPEPPPELHDAVRDAAQYCPCRAITLLES